MRAGPSASPSGERLTTSRACGFSALKYKEIPFSRRFSSAWVKMRSAVYSKSGMALHSKITT